jgi:hypothetical protein
MKRPSFPAIHDAHRPRPYQSIASVAEPGENREGWKPCDLPSSSIVPSRAPTSSAPRACAFEAYAEALDDAGVLASAEMLQPSNETTTVRLASGDLVVRGGPLTDTKEQLGGSFVIEVPRLDDAIEQAWKAPSVSWAAPIRGGTPLRRLRALRSSGAPAMSA